MLISSTKLFTTKYNLLLFSSFLFRKFWDFQVSYKIQVKLSIFFRTRDGPNNMKVIFKG